MKMKIGLNDSSMDRTGVKDAPKVDAQSLPPLQK